MATAIRAARKRKGWTQEIAAQKAGLPKRTYESYERGEIGNPAMDKVRAIANALDLAIADLQPGQGDGGKREAPPVMREAPARYGGYYRVPVYGEAAAETRGTCRAIEEPFGYRDLTAEEYTRTFQRPPPRNGEEAVGYFRIVGDSASPIYLDGEDVPVELVPREQRQQFKDETVYVFRWREDLYVKRLQKLEGGAIRAYSLNPDIEVREFKPADDNEFEILGRVLNHPKQQLYAAFVGRTLGIRGSE